jgi:hypothetical protein
VSARSGQRKNSLDFGDSESSIEAEFKIPDYLETSGTKVDDFAG